MKTATLTDEGQLTLLAEVRPEAGGRVSLMPTDDGFYKLVAKTGSIRDVKGILSKPERGATLAHIDENIAQTVTDQNTCRR